MARVAVVGAGAVGGYVGGRMAQKGVDVTLVGMWPAHVEVIRRDGLRLSGSTPEETALVPVRALHLGEVQSLVKETPIDVAFVAVKSNDTRWATALIAPYLASHGCVVSLQNGINEEQIAGVVGWGKTLGVAINQINVTAFEPGRIKRTGPIGGERHTVFRVGELHGRPTRRAENVAALLRHCDSAKVTANLWGERWSKLVLTAMGMALSVVTGLSVSERERNDEARGISIRLASEAIRVGQCLGYPLETMAKMEPEVLARAGEGDAGALAQITELRLEYASNRTAENRPSMAADVANGRMTEIDYINGYVVRRGREVGIPTPVNAIATALVKELERGELQPGLHNLVRFT